MRCTLIGFFVIAMFAAQVPAQSGPSTRPAQTPSAEKLRNPVLILPFVSPSDPKYQSAGQAIQQVLANALAADLRGRAIAPAGAHAAPDAGAALAAARERDAAAVVFGQMQVNDDQVQLTGQVLDATDGRSLGSLHQSGALSELFRLEDALTPQVVAALPASLLNLHGLLSARQPTRRPQMIYLPGETPAPLPAPYAGSAPYPVPGGYAGPEAPYTLPPPPGGTPPYSPYAGSYPYRFVAPYAHLFSYDYDPDPFLPIPNIIIPGRIVRPAPARPHEMHREEVGQPARK